MSHINPTPDPLISPQPIRDGRVAGTVDALHHAYRVGRARPRASSDNVRAQWEKGFKIRSWEKDRQVLSPCMRYIEEARKSAACGQIDLAHRLFEVARACSESTILSADGRLLCTEQLAASEAYLSYYCGDFEAAKRHLFVSMAADQELEETFHYPAFHAHRLHLMNNMVKLEAAAQNLSVAMDLAADIYLYLDRKVETLPVPGGWGESYLCHLPAEVFPFLSGQLSNEIAAALAGLPRAIAGKALEVLLSRIDVNERHDSWSSDTHDWLRLKVLMADLPQADTYLGRCIPYLSQGPGWEAGLWYLTALDVVTVCQDIDWAASALLQQEILDDLRRITRFPRRVRAAITQLADGLKPMNSSAPQYA